MYHEATACHVTGDLSDLMDIITNVIQVTRTQLQERKGNLLNTTQGAVIVEM